MLDNLRHFFIGPPLSTQRLAHERLNKVRALAAFSPDALSSIAYANQEIFLGLVVAGAAGLPPTAAGGLSAAGAPPASNAGAPASKRSGAGAVGWASWALCADAAPAYTSSAAISSNTAYTLRARATPARRELRSLATSRNTRAW